MTLPTPKTEIRWSSYSGIASHRACPQRWSYSYLYGLRKPWEDDAKPELHFGNWWHAIRAADSIERGREIGSILYVPKDIRTTDTGPRISTEVDDSPGAPSLTQRVLDAAEAWAEGLTDEHAAAWVEKLGQHLPTRLSTLDDRWREEWRNQRTIEQPLGVEVKWVRTVPGSELELVGYVDEVYYDSARNLTVVRDHKTSKALSTQTTADDMMDSQLHLYPWGLAEKIKEWGVPSVSAISYDRVRSTKPTTPKLTAKTRKLTSTITQYDLATYLQFCADNAEEYAEDPAIVAHLSSPAWRSTWFQRTLTPLNRNLTRAHLQAAVDSVKDTVRTIETVQRRGEAPRNLTGAACRWCDFAKLCRAQMLGGPDGDYDPEDYGLTVSQPKTR